MKKIGLDVPKGFIASSLRQSEILKQLDFPIIIRPSFTLGGSEGELQIIAIPKNRKKGLNLSPISEVLIEESLVGWKEYEMEVIRDFEITVIVCSIENIDPMGVHTGDSITVTALTLTDKEYQKMRNQSIQVIREIGVETGGAMYNLQLIPNR